MPGGRGQIAAVAGLLLVGLLPAATCERSPEEMWTPDLGRHRPGPKVGAGRGVGSSPQGGLPQDGKTPAAGRTGADAAPEASYRAEVLRAIRQVEGVFGEGGEEALAGARQAVSGLDREKALPELRALLDAGPEVGAGAARVAGLLADPSLVLGLVKGLRSPDLFFAQACAWALGETRARGALGVMTQMLAEDRPPPLRAAIARALGAIGDPAAVPNLLAAASDPAPAVRAGAIAALGRLGSAAPGAMEAIRKALEDEDREVRLAAATALVAQKSPQAVPTLVKLLEAPSEDIRQIASKALVEFPEPSLVRPALMDAIESGDGAARLYVVDTLIRACDRSCVEVLRARAKRCRNDYARNALEAVVRGIESR